MLAQIMDCPRPTTHDGTIDWEYSRQFSLWRCMVRRLFPDKFKIIDEGMRVIWDDPGLPGTVTSVIYFPKTGKYYITVARSNRNYYFTSPYDLEIVYNENYSFN